MPSTLSPAHRLERRLEHPLGFRPEHRLDPFRPAQAGADEVRILLRDGLVRPVVGDVVASCDAPSDRWLRARSARLLIPSHAEPRVVGFASAAWVLTGLPGPPARLEVLVPPGQRRPAGEFLRGRQTGLAAQEVTELFGLAITTPVRTAADVARDLAPLPALELLHHLGSIAGVRPGQVLRQLSRMRYARGAAQARKVVRAWADCA